MKTSGVQDISVALNHIRQILKNKALHAYVFGSVTSNAAVPFESDVDVLIIPKVPLSLEQTYEILKKPWEALMEQGLVLRPIVFDSKRHPQWLLSEAKKGIQLF